MMVEAYVSGVSQRKMGDVTEAPWVSRGTLDGEPGRELVTLAPIEGAHPYLYHARCPRERSRT